MIRSSILIFVSLFCTTATAESRNVIFKIEVQEYSEHDALIAVEMFRRACRPLGAEFWNDVEQVTIEITKETAEHRLARGWKNYFSLALKYADKPSYGPAYASGAGVLAGHTLYYDLGGGLTPGYLAIKQSSQYLCGLSVDRNGGQVFVPVPNFEFLNR